MPTYDYACDDCGHRFEIRQSFTDDPLTLCPECSGHIRRVIHPSGIIFKGSGWYITDSRDTTSAAAPATDSGGTESATSDSSKTESSKPESTSSETMTPSTSSSDSKAAADD